MLNVKHVMIELIRSKIHIKKVVNQNSYNDFINAGELKKIRVIKNDIAAGIKQNFSSYPPKNLELELFYYQKLVTKLLGSSLHKTLCKIHITGKKSGINIPREWQKYFVNKFEISQTKSQIQFRLFLVSYTLFSLLKSFYFLTPTLKNKIANELANKKNEGYKIVFLNANMTNPNLFDLDNSNSQCFSNWYKEFLNNKKVLFLHSSKKIERTKTLDYLYLNKIPIKNSSYLKFVFRCMIIYCHAFALLIVGNYKELFCISDLVNNLRARMAPLSFIPDVLIFNESNSILRPLYSYTLEARGCSVQNFSFSVSSTVNLHGEQIDFFPNQLSTWSKQFVFDKYQASYLSEAKPIKDVDIEIINQIPFYSDTNFKLTPNLGRYVALFDITPVPTHFGATTLNDIGVQDVVIWHEFLLSCIYAAKELELNILYKPKRIVLESIHGIDVFKAINDLRNNTNFHILDSNISPHRLILNSTAVVSAAVTTPGYIAKQLKIPSVFYSFNNKLSQEDPVLREIPVVYSNSQLKHWLLKFI